MARVDYEICDRCRDKIDREADGTQYRLKAKKPKWRIKLTNLGRGFCAHSYSDYNYDLCKKCGELMHEFLRGKRWCK